MSQVIDEKFILMEGFQVGDYSVVYFVMRKVGSGYTVDKCYVHDGWKRMSFTNCKEITLNCPFSTLKSWLEKQKGLYLPYICNICDGGEMYMAYFSPKEGKVPNITESLDICGKFMVGKKWPSEVTEEEWNRYS